MALRWERKPLIAVIGQGKINLVQRKVRELYSRLKVDIL